MSSPEAVPQHVPASDAGPRVDRLGLYVPRVLQQRLVDAPGTRWWTAAGTAAFVDISGFTKLSEQLARKGKEGAEQISEVIERSFESILQVAYDRGGSLLKFGGDALLLWFEGEGHLERAAHATLAMRSALDVVGRIALPEAEVVLQMSQGVHAGEFHFFAVGGAHTELLPTGPGWSRLVSMEQALLRARGLESLVFVGTTTEGCLESSVRSASYRDFYVTVVEDLVFSPNRELHEGSLRLMRQRYPVAASQAVLAAWGAR